MSDTAAEMLKDRLNDIERNAYDGIDFRQDANAAYALADELGNGCDRLKAENDRLRRLCLELYRKYRHVEGVLFVDLDMDELEGRLRKLGMETWEAWE